MTLFRFFCPGSVNSCCCIRLTFCSFSLRRKTLFEVIIRVMHSWDIFFANDGKNPYLNIFVFVLSHSWKQATINNKTTITMYHCPVSHSGTSSSMNKNNRALYTCLTTTLTCFIILTTLLLYHHQGFAVNHGIDINVHSPVTIPYGWIIQRYSFRKWAPALMSNVIKYHRFLQKCIVN